MKSDTVLIEKVLKFKISTLGAEPRIHVKNLANKHNIKYEETELDKFANKVTELSGDTVTQDNTQNLIIALFRSKIITKRELVKLNVKHISELRNN